MNEQDRAAVRRALRVLSDGTPSVPWTGPEVQQRAAGVRRRRRAGATGALAVTAVLGLAAVQLPAGPRQTLRPAADLLPTLPAPLPTGVEVPTVLPAPSEKPPPSRPPRPGESPTAEPTGTSSPANSPDDRPGSVQMRVAASPVRTETATFVAVSVHVQQPGDVPLTISVDFGDGTVWPTGTSRRDTDMCKVIAQSDREYTIELQHAYRAAGDYDVAVEARAYDGSPCRERVLIDRVTVHVEQGAVVSNGPALPRAKGNVREVEENGVLGVGGTTFSRLHASGYDEDGWITQLVVDWGDGSDPTVVDFGTEGCTDSPTRWPSNGVSEEIDHEYHDESQHRITVTATSAGCDGQDQQTATFEFDRLPAGG